MSDTVDTRLGRIEGKVDMLVALQASHNGLTAELAKRIGVLERSKSYFLGAAAVVGAVASFAVTKIKGI